MRRLIFRTGIVLSLVMLLLAGCTNSTSPTAPPLAEGTVLIKQIASTLLGGTIYGHGETAVILASRGGYNQLEWAKFAHVLADAGFTGLTMGSLDSESQTIINVGYAIEFLRNHGFKKILCVGASNGASGCTYNAAAPEIMGMVLITYHGSADLSNTARPKLFIGAEIDDVYRPVSEREYKLAMEPKTLIIVPGTSLTGPDILDAADQNLNQIVLDFLKQCIE